MVYPCLQSNKRDFLLYGQSPVIKYCQKTSNVLIPLSQGGEGGWKVNINDSELQWKGNNRVKTVWLQLACTWLQGFLSLICYSSVGTASHWCWAIGVWRAVGIPAHLQGVRWGEVKAEHRRVMLLHTEARKTFLYRPHTVHAAMSG